MDIYFKCLSPSICVYLEDCLTGPEESPPNLQPDKIIHWKTDDVSYRMVYNEIPKDVPLNRVISIGTFNDADRLIGIIQGKELARFNSGKPEFTYIDFRLFNFLLESCVDPNKVHWSRGKLLNLLLLSTSTLCFEEDKKVRLKALQDLQVFSYHLSLIYTDIPVDPDDQEVRLDAFESMARVLAHGAKRYERNNWRKHSSNPLSAADSLDRHVKYLKRGEQIDTDFGEHHIGHIMCNVMFLIYHLNLES